MMKRGELKKKSSEDVYLVSFWRWKDENRKEKELINFIGKLQDVMELRMSKQKKEFEKVWREEMGKGKKMPMFVVSFVRKDILWSSIDTFFIPIRVTDVCRSGTSPEVVRWMMNGIFVDVVNVIPKDQVESEIERWKLLTSL